MNQQSKLKEAINNARKNERSKERGRALAKYGKDYQDISDRTVFQNPGVKHLTNHQNGTGGGSHIDNIIKKGRKTVYMETKCTIRNVNERMINQLTNAVRLAKPGDLVILNVARKPTRKERKVLRQKLSNPVYGRIKILSSQTAIYRAVINAFSQEAK